MIGFESSGDSELNDGFCLELFEFNIHWNGIWVIWYDSLLTIHKLWWNKIYLGSSLNSYDILGDFDWGDGFRHFCHQKLQIFAKLEFRRYWKQMILVTSMKCWWPNFNFTASNCHHCKITNIRLSPTPPYCPLTGLTMRTLTLLSIFWN